MPEESIVDIAAKCRVLLLDIEGTTTSISFVKDKLFPYASEHVRGFLERSWEDEEVRAAVAALRQLAISDAEEKMEGVVTVPAEQDADKAEQISALVDSVEWLMSKDRKAGPLKLLQGLIWKQGYDKGDIQGHVYSDVADALAAWRAVDSRRIYIYSSGSEQAQRLLFGHSAAGDLLPLIDGHFDTAVGGKQEQKSYKTIAEKIDCPPEKILFLTDVVGEAEAARGAGLQVALVSRDGNSPLPADVPFPVLTSLADLFPATTTPTADDTDTNTNKRKQEVQEDQPTKVAKASLEDNIKSSVEGMTANGDTPPAELMDVDAASTASIDESSVTEEVENIEAKEKEEILIEELPDTDEPVASPIPPVVIEEPAPESDIDMKTAESKSEALEQDEEIVEKPEEKESMDAEESTPVETVIAEVNDDTSEQVLEQVDLEPIVEEPLDVAAEAEVLQNVGDELEKECDDLLSKVKDVTDLAQPLLATVNEDAGSGDAAAKTVADEPSTKTKEDESEGFKEDGEAPETEKTNETAERLVSKGNVDNVEEKMQVNGDTKDANGVKVNGSSNGDERLNSAENGKKEEPMNGNGIAGGKDKAGAEIPEIKVKSVPAAEVSTEPVEQPIDA